MWVGLVSFFGCIVAAVLGVLYGRCMRPNIRILKSINSSEVLSIPTDVIKLHPTVLDHINQHDDLQTDHDTALNKITSLEGKLNRLQAANAELLHAAFMPDITETDAYSDDVIKSHPLYEQLHNRYIELKSESKIDIDAVHKRLNAQINTLYAEAEEQKRAALELQRKLETTVSQKLAAEKQAQAAEITLHEKSITLSEESIISHPLYQSLLEQLNQFKEECSKLKHHRDVLAEQQKSLNNALLALKKDNLNLVNKLDNDRVENAERASIASSAPNISINPQDLLDSEIKLHKCYQTLQGQYNSALKELATLKNVDLKNDIASLKKDKHNLLIENEELKLSLAESADSKHQISQYANPLDARPSDSHSQLEIKSQPLDREKKLQSTSKTKNRIDINTLDETDILAIPKKIIAKHRAYRVLIAQYRELQHAYDNLRRERSSFVANQIAEKSILNFDADLAESIYGKRIRADDLTVISGINSKIAGLFAAENVQSWYTLSQTSPERCQEILKNAGARYREKDASTWPRQAKMAFEGKWQALHSWQERLANA